MAWPACVGAVPRGTDGGNLGVADPHTDIVGDLGCNAVVCACVDQRTLQRLNVRPHAQLFEFESVFNLVRATKGSHHWVGLLQTRPARVLGTGPVQCVALDPSWHRTP